METNDELPAPSTPFTLSEAKDIGFAPEQLRGRSFVHVSRGLYRPAQWDFDLLEAAQALSAATPGAWISHSTAARLQGLILPPWLSDSDELHLSKPQFLPSARRKGIHGHATVAFPDEVETDRQLRISTRARTWLDLARVLPLPELVCIGDQLIRVPRPQFEERSEPYATRGSLRRMVLRHGNLQGIVCAREALELMRVGSDSGPETLMRLAMVDAGLPEPELQVKLWDTQTSPSADAGYRDKKIALQYDGGHHLDEMQRQSDIRRDTAFRSAGWQVLIFTDEDLADGFDQAVRNIRQARRQAWTAPSIASGFASGS